MIVNFSSVHCMHALIIIRRVITLIFFCGVGAAHCANPFDLNLAFYYGANPPLNQLKLFKNIVVEPSSGIDPKALESTDHKVFAYTSLGEAINVNQYSKPIDKSWVIAANDTWQSIVLDQSNPAWQAFYLNDVITPLWNKGYRGFFLDTLDSYRLASSDPVHMKKQQQGLISTIRAIKNKYPDAKIIVNRGFEILPEIKSLVDEVIVESLFNGWNNKSKTYFTVSAQETEKLFKELDKIKAMGIPITIVDYVAPDNPEKAKNAAQKIAALGFNPWITNGDLTALYLFNVEILPRKIILMYQGKINDVDEKVGSDMSKAVAMPLNYMGYSTVLYNINEPLPKDISPEKYAGIVVAMDGFLPGREKELYDWYRTQMQNRIPLVILYNFGFPPGSGKLELFNVTATQMDSNPKTFKVVYKSPLIGYEINPVFTPQNFTAITLTQGTSLLKVATENGIVSDIAAFTPWGGYYLTNNLILPTIGRNYRWSINPFLFFKKALRLPDLPVPDLTTENGRRLMFVHIDGDGFANKGQWFKGPFAGEVMRKEFFEHYAIPTTVSIIQGEIAPNGIHPNFSDKLEQIARKIFALPYIEIASHTFSHPFNWRDAAAYDYKKSPINPYTLPVQNYRFNLESEIKGSVEYINHNLAPADKKCRVFLWSGEGDVPPRALELAQQLGLANINPGTIITLFNNSLTRVSALGIFEGPNFQVFAPIGNDAEAIGVKPYFYTLISIIDALKLTDKPRRLKPIDIYLHFFTASQKGGIKAMHQVYDWALAQPVMNIYASDYFNKVIDFNQLLIAKKDDGWLIETNDQLREVRVPCSMGYPDLDKSRNLIGFNTYNDDCYIHLGPGGDAFVRLINTPPEIPYLVDANTRVTHFVRTDKGIDFSVEGYLPPEFTFANMEKCALWKGHEPIKELSIENKQKSYALTKGTKYDFSIRCN